MSKLYVVGIGPGGLNHMTFEAREAIDSADVVVGYKTYLEFIQPILEGKEVVSSGMMREVERCEEALAIAASGRRVALVSSGDAGVYGMAGLALELANVKPGEAPEIIVVPGVSAVQAAASVLGAPLMHDFAVISLSDLLTPWELIRKRLDAAARADFVTALYNPRSKGRVTQLEEAREIFLAHRSPDATVGIVRNACRQGEERVVATLADMLGHQIDMFSIVIIGNSATFLDGKGKMVTPRGYKGGSFTLRPPPPINSGKAVMICGSGSDVGKSVITAGLCRILKRRGLNVAPFKSQNMALNSAVTPEGGEIGRAQAVQAMACGILPHTDMNPILLKPNSDTGSQVIVQGAVVGNMRVAQYNAYKPEAFAKVRESFERLQGRHDFIVMEGAGSIAEINLKSHDIANLKAAEMANAPAILVADIDRGGVFAQIVGTMELLSRAEKVQIKGVIINKFRGDASLLASGIDFAEQRTGVPVLGVVPCFTGFRIPEEDSFALGKRRGAREGVQEGKIRVGVVRLPRISNYTDFDALEAEPDAALCYIEHPGELEGIDLLILPGSKSTIADLLFLKERGLFEAIRGFSGMVAGVCGGYQMLGGRVLDPCGVESDIRETAGLGLLDAKTSMLAAKETHQVEARLLAAGNLVAPDCSGGLSGYEIHMGETTLGPGSMPFARISSRSGNPVEIFDGAVSPDGRVFGTYIHGVFDNALFRTPFLNRIRKGKGLPEQAAAATGADPFDLLADHLERHLDMDKIFHICGLT